MFAIWALRCVTLQTHNPACGEHVRAQTASRPSSQRLLLLQGSSVHCQSMD